MASLPVNRFTAGDFLRALLPALGAREANEMVEWDFGLSTTAAA